MFRLVEWNDGRIGSNIIVMDTGIQPQVYNDAGVLEDDDNIVANMRDRSVISVFPLWWQLPPELRHVALMHELGHAMTNEHGAEGNVMSPWVGKASRELTEDDLELVRAEGFCLQTMPKR